MQLLWLATVFAASAASQEPYGAELEARRASLLAQRGRPEAAVLLLGLEDFLPWVVPARVEEVARLGDHPTAHPLVRLQAKSLLALVAQKRGRFDEAAKRRAQAGFLTHFRVVGTFDNDSGTGLTRHDGPEDSADIAWRKVPNVYTSAVLPLGALYEPDDNVCAYAETYLRAKRPTKAALHVGSSGPLRVWVGKTLVFERDVLRPIHADQDAVAIRLDRGWNRLLIKSCVRTGPWGIILRLTDAQARPLVLMTAREPPPDGATGGGAGHHAIQTLKDVLEQRSRRNPNAFATWRDWGRFLYFVTPDDPNARRAHDALRQALALRGDTDTVRLMAASVDRPDERRRILEDASMTSSRLLVELGDAYQELSRDHIAWESWQRALAANSHDVQAQLRVASHLESLGQKAQALAMLLDAERMFSEAWAVKLAVAQWMQRADRLPEARARLLEYLAEFPGDSAQWTTLTAVERSLGNTAGAIHAAEQASRAAPASAAAAFEASDLLAGAGQWQQARDRLETALAVAPEDPRILEHLGRLLARAGQREAATARFLQALALAPQKAELRKYVDYLEGGRLSSLDRFRRSIGEFRSLPEPASGTDSAEVLWDLTAVEIHENGLSRTLRQRFVRILDDRGTRGQAETPIRYSPSTQNVDVRVARVYRGAMVLDSAIRFDQDLSQPWFRLYYDYRAIVVRMSDLRPGDILELEWTIEDRANQNILGDYYGDLFLLQETIPRRSQELVLVAPMARALYFNEPRLPTLTREVENLSGAEGIQRVYRFRAADASAILAEPGMPGWTTVAAYLHVSTYKSWADLATWYRGLIAQALVPDEQVRQAAHAAVAGVTDPRERVRRIYQLVVGETRYVGLEFGIHGYEPHRVPVVWARKFGDCKDKASLIVAMLQEVGIPATLVALRTRPRGELDDLPASLAAFDHAIVYVPSLDLYLDGTAEFHSASDLPVQDQGVSALRITDGQFVRTPVLPAEQNRVTRERRFEMDAPSAGSGALEARVTETLRLVGQAAPAWREYYQAADQRHERYERAWNERFPGAHAEAIEMEVSDIGQPVVVRARLRLPTLGRRLAGHSFALPATAQEGELTRTYARSSSRRVDLVLDYPWVQEEQFHYKLGACLEIVALPQSRRVESPFGEFEMTVSSEPHSISVAVRLAVKRYRILPTEYSAFRAFLGNVDEILSQEIRVTCVR